MIFFFGFAILYPNKPTHFHIHFLSIRLNCPTSCLLFPSTDIVCLRNAARPLDMSAPISTTIIIYPTATNHAVLALNPQQPCLPSTHNCPVCHPVRLWPPRQDGGYFDGKAFRSSGMWRRAVYCPQTHWLSFLSWLGHTSWKRTRCDLYNMTYFGFTIKILNYKRIL